MSDRWLMLLSIAAASFISTMNVDSPEDMLSLAPTRVKILSTTPMRAACAGTKLPACAIRAIRAVWRSSADFPLMFGPVIIMICVRSQSRVSELEMYGSPGGRRRSMTGCRPSVMSRTRESSTVGRE